MKKRSERENAVENQFVVCFFFLFVAAERVEVPMSPFSTGGGEFGVDVFQKADEAKCVVEVSAHGKNGRA